MHNMQNPYANLGWGFENQLYQWQQMYVTTSAPIPESPKQLKPQEPKLNKNLLLLEDV